MEKLYNLNHSVLPVRPAVVAVSSLSSVKKQTILLFVSVLLLFTGNSFGQTITFTSKLKSNATSGSWTDPSIWTVSPNNACSNCYPTATSNVFISSGDRIIIENGTEAACNTLTLEPSGNASGRPGAILQIGSAASAGTLTVNEVTVTKSKHTNKENGAFDIYPKGYLKITDNINAPDDFITILVSSQFPYETTFVDPKTYGTVEYSKSILKVTNFYLLQYPSLKFTGEATVSGGIQTLGNLTISKVLNASTTPETAITHTIKGNLITESTGTLNAGNSTINIGGNFTNSGIFNKGTSTVNYNGATQIVAGVPYYNLTLSGSGIKTSAASLSTANNLDVIAGATFDANAGTHAITKNLSNAGIINAGSSTIQIGSSFTNTGTFNSGTGVVLYSGTTSDITQNVAGVTYNNLQFSGSSVKIATASLSTKGNLTINLGSNFSAGSFTHTISGNWANAGTFTSGTSTVVMNGLSKTITSARNSGAFKNLTISNGDATLNSSIIVLGTLDLGAYIYTGTNTLQLGGTGQLARAETSGQYILGNLSASRIISSGTTSQPVIEPFGNIGISFTNDAPVTSSVTLNVIRTTGTAIDGIDGDKVSATRVYDITSGTLSDVPGLKASFSFIERELTETSDKYTLYGERYDVNGVYDFAEITDATQVVRSAGSTFNMSTIKDLGRYTIAARPTTKVPLPVELAWFKAQRQGQRVLLTWETASEKENKGFEVQTSADGKSFSKVAFVDSKVVNSAVRQSYSYIDQTSAVAGTRYYRLAQIDLDGTTTFSNIRAVSMDAAPVAVKAYPNPFAEGQQVAVQLAPGESRQVSLVLTNALGQVILRQQVQVQEGVYNLPVDVTAAKANGMYLLSVLDNGTKYSFKLIKR